MAFNFKKALAFTLAAAMVVTAAPSASITADAAAKKPSITASKTINAEKTASIKVNTVKKGRFIKITSISKASNVTIKAKINGKNTKLKKNKYYKVTGKSVTLKVTGADAIADYTSTIKVSVFDKKGKKYNVVKPKNLTAKVKVKASEFSITNVVSTVDAGVNGSKYVRATFSKAIDALDASEVEITEKGSGQIFTVNKVTLSSNKKMADIELLGADDAAGSIRWLKPNVDYIFKITKAGVTGQFEFSIPDVAKDSVVTAVDSTKKTIKAKQITNGAYGGESTYTVPDSLKVDYQELLGTTQNIKFDKTNTIISISPIGNEKVIYSAFKAVDDDKTATTLTDNYIYDVATKTKYYAQDAASGSIPASMLLSYAKLENHVAITANNIGTRAAAEEKYAYGKLVLNGNGTIRTFMPLDKWSGNIYVSSVNGTYISSQAKEEQNLDGYAILKDGKTITVSDIKAGDVVFFQTSYKYAEVYTSSKTGAIEAAYDDGFKFGGETYKSENAYYFDASGAKKSVDAAYLKGVLAAKKDVVVFFNRAGEAVYVLGEEAVVASADTTLILTAAGDGYQDKKDNMIELKGFDGKEIVTKNINVADLESVTVEDKEWAKPAATIAAGADYSTATKGETLSFNSGAKVLNINSDLSVGKMVTVTADANGKITKMVVGNGVALVKGAAGTTFDLLGTGKDFKGGYKNINTANIAASVPVYVVNKTDNNVSVKFTAYSEFTQTVKNDYLSYVYVYYTNDKKTDVKAVVIDNQDGTALGEDDDGSVESEVIIKSISYLDKAISSITVLKGTEEKTYSKFANTIKTEFKAGDFVKITILKDGETVKKDSIVADTTTKATGNIANVSESNGTFEYKVAGAYEKYTMSNNVTIAQIDSDKNVKLISKTDLASAARKFEVKFSETVANSKTVDSILVTATSITSTNDQTGKGQELIDAFNNAAWVVSAAAATSSASYKFSNTNLAQVISGRAAYSMATDDQKVLDSAIKDFESAGGKFSGTNEIISGAAYAANKYVAVKNALDDAIKYAKTNMIIGISFLAVTEVATNNGEALTNAQVNDSIISELPGSISFTMAGDGVETVTLKKGTYDKATGEFVPGDWIVVSGAAVAGQKVAIAGANINSTTDVQFGLIATGSVYTWNKNAYFANDLAIGGGDGPAKRIGSNAGAIDGDGTTTITSGNAITVKTFDVK